MVSAGAATTATARAPRAVYTFALVDGGTLILDGFSPPAQTPVVTRSEGTLAGDLTALEWIGDAIAAGITFDALKALAAQMISHGWNRTPAQPSAESIAATATRYLSSVGYIDITVSEIRLVADAGWTFAGTANGRPLRGRAEPSGQLVHVRVE